MALSLRVNVVEKNVTKTLQFDPSTSIFDACKIIRDKCSELNMAQPKDYGLFLAGETPGSGAWLEPAKTLDYYLLRNGDTVEYQRKMRTLKVRTLDGTNKTMLVDDSQNVANLMVVICTKMGITNHDEYSLVRDLPDEIDGMKTENYGTLTSTLRRKEKERDAKMEQLRKKLKTDDEINWIDHTKTLREQGVEPEEILLLRRKFFFSDQNIDSHDPVQLNLLYVQARDAILDGTHPITQEKACEFGGIQCQINFGDHNAQKHRIGFLDLKEFLPSSYVKTKGIEKKLFGEHRRHMGMSELDAKALYTKLARSLPTYGVTFFLVKEKMQGKNKLVPRLLGVTKDSVLRLDERTKEILRTWPLTTVRRWAASPNTFTLDFGDYSDQYYSVQTVEGEQIAQLIAGYIDIIMKKKQAKDHLGIEGDEGSTLVEESISPLKATIVQRQLPNKPTQPEELSVAKPVLLHSAAGIHSFHTGHIAGAQYSTLRGQLDMTHSSQPSVHLPQMSEVQVSSTQKAFVSGRDAIERSKDLLDSPFNLPAIGHDPASRKWKETTMDTKKQNVHSQIASMSASTATLMTTAHTLNLQSSEDVVDSGAVCDSVSTISSGLPEVAKDVRMIAALMDENGDKLLDATRRLCNAFSELLLTVEPGNKEPRQNLIHAVGKVGEASRSILNTIGEGDESQDILLGLSKNIANHSAALVVQARKCAATIEETSHKEEIISSAAQTALSASELVALSKVVAPTISSPKCRDELMGACKRVAQSVESVVETSNHYTRDETLKRDLLIAARDVSDSLNRLMEHIRPANRISVQENMQEDAVDTIFITTDKILTTEDSNDMVKQARILAQATANLIQSIKGEAEKTPDSELQKKLIAAARILAEATSRLVEAAKVCAQNPHPNSQDQLKQAAQELREATNVAAGGTVYKKNLKRLETAAKTSAAAAAQTIAASQSASPHVSNNTTKEALSSDCRAVANSIPQLVSAVKISLQNGDETSLIEATDKFLKPSNSLVSTSKQASNFITEPSASRHLIQCSQRLAVELVELRTSLDRIKVDSGITNQNQPRKQLDASAARIREVKEEIVQCLKAASKKELRPLPGDTPENSIQRLSSSVRKVGNSTDQLVTSVTRSDENAAISSSQAISSGLNDLVNSSRAVASLTRDVRILHATEEVLERSWTLITESGGLLGSNEVQSREKESQLNPLAKGVHEALDKISNSIPGQQNLEESIQNINNSALLMESGGFNKSPKSPSAAAGMNFGRLQSELHQLAQDVSDSSQEIVTATPNPTKVGNESKFFSSKVINLMHTGYNLANLHEDIHIREEIIINLKNLSIITSNFLVIAKDISANPEEVVGGKNQLTIASRSVNDSLNQLIDICSTETPGQKECDNAIRRIQALKPLLNNPNEPLNNNSYFDCQQNVVEKSKLLGDSMTGIANFAKEGRLNEFGISVNSASEAICGLIESSAQAAYLLGASESTSVAGRQGIVDLNSINQSTANIKAACQTLSNPKVNQQQILSSATTIAKYTSALCTSCRVASERTNNPTTKRQFVQMAKDVANATSFLVQEIKAIDQEKSGAKREQATMKLIKSVNSLVQFASQPEFLSVPAKISPKGRTIQEPIVSSARNVIDGSSNLLESAKSLAINPKDPPSWQKLAQYSKHVSDSIKQLVTGLRDKAPGQIESETGVQRLKDSLRHLQEASHSAMSQTLKARKDNTIQGFIQNAENSVRMAEEHIEPLKNSGKFQAENLGHQVNSIVAIIDNLVANVIGASSNIVDSKEQYTLLERTGTVLESCVQFVCTAKESGGNPKATSIHPELDSTAQSFQESLDELVTTLRHIISSGSASLVSMITDSIASSMVKLDQTSFTQQSGARVECYVDFQTRMVNAVKEIARLSNDMVSKANVDANQLSSISSEISHHYSQLSNDARGAISTVLSQDVSIRLRCGVQELGKGVIDLIRCGGVVQFSPEDTYAHRDLSDSNRIVSEKVSDVLAALQAGSRGTQACLNAASTVSGIIGDLDTTIMFATAGALQDGDESFEEYKNNILKTAKSLVEDTKSLVAGAASNQEQLASAAQNAVETILQLSESVKMGASSLGSNNPEAQVMLIHAVRDVAASLYDLIHSTKNAAGKGLNDPSMIALKESAKTMVCNVTGLLKTVQAVEDEHTRGTRAIEGTIEAISQEIRAFDTQDPPAGKPASPDDLVRATKPVMVAVSKAVAGGFSCKQEDIIVAANMGRKAISDLLLNAKSAAYGVDGDLRERTLIEARKVAVNYKELLQIVLYAVEHPEEDLKDKLTESSRNIASITDLLSLAQLMKVVHNQLDANPMFGQALRHSHNVQKKGNSFEDPDDPTVIAENELLGAANSIDAAAKKLEKLKPRKSIKDVDESLNFDEMILAAAKAIACATSALVKAASAAQRELVDTGRVSRKATSESDDGQWSEGLVSAAQLVAAATHSLVEAANSLVQGHATEEKLISAAKQVASSTAQLLVACKVKASPDSDSTRRLQAAGNAVKRATDNLVKAAQQALAQEEERQLVLNKRMVGGIAQEINARSEVLKIERQLEDARGKLAAIRKAKYQEKTGGTAGFIDDGSDVDIETSYECSRLENLLESQTERINSAANAFSIMRQQQQNQSQHYITPTQQFNMQNPSGQGQGQGQSSFQNVTTPKPSISPKPIHGFLSSTNDRKFNSSPSQYSTISDSSYQALNINSGNTASGGGGSLSGGGVGDSDDMYARPISATSSSASTPSTVKTYMKLPSEFYTGPSNEPAKKQQPLFGKPFQPPPIPQKMVQSQKHHQQEQGDNSNSSFQREFTQYDSGPIESERVIETTRPDGSISLKRIFETQQQQSSITSSQISSSRKVFQKSN